MDLNHLLPEYQEIFLEGMEAMKSKDWAKAEANFTKVLEAYPDLLCALESRAAVKMHLGDTQGAQDDLMRALNLDPNNARIYYRLGQVYYRRNELELAMELFTKAIDLDPMYSAAYLARSQVLRDKGMEEAADLELQKAVNASREIAKARKVIDF